MKLVSTYTFRYNYHVITIFEALNIGYNLVIIAAYMRDNY